MYKPRRKWRNSTFDFREFAIVSNEIQKIVKLAHAVVFVYSCKYRLEVQTVHLIRHFFSWSEHALIVAHHTAWLKNVLVRVMSSAWRPMCETWLFSFFPHFVIFLVFILSPLLLPEPWLVPLPFSCGFHRGKIPLALRQLRSLAPWPKMPSHNSRMNIDNVQQLVEKFESHKHKEQFL